jgi:hypothetical protein
VAAGLRASLMPHHSTAHCTRTKRSKRGLSKRFNAHAEVGCSVLDECYFIFGLQLAADQINWNSSFQFT